MRDAANDISVVQTIVPIVCNNTTEGTGTVVDLQGWEAATAILHIGDSGDTLSGSVSWTPTLQHSNTTTPGDFVNVPAADMTVNTFSLIDAPAEDQVVQVAGYIGERRYLRVLVTATGTHTNGTPLSAVIVRERGRHLGGNAV